MLAMRHRGGHRAALCLFATVLAVAAGLAAAAPGLTEWSLKLNPQDSQGSVTAAAARPEEKAGYLTVGPNQRRMFYYFFQARTTGGAPVPLPSAPLVLWLNGGPGCSSLVGLFLENGPYRVTPKLTLVPANHSWTSVAHMLYVDSPLPTGLSYATRNDDSGRPDTVRTMQDVGVTLLQFMKLFLASRPQLLQAPLYLTGESFAGQYLPVLAAMVQNDTDAASWKLKGLLLVDPWVNAPAMYASYPALAASRLLPLNLTTAAAVAESKALLPRCLRWQAMCQAMRNPDTCWLALDECLWVIDVLYVEGYDLNVYNIREPCAGTLCLGAPADDVAKYINKNKAQWGVPANVTFQLCNMWNGSPLDQDRALSRDMLLAPLLDSGIRILFYQGDLDFIVNDQGTMRMLDQLMWGKEAAWASAKSLPWKVNGAQAGVLRQAGPLAMARFNRAGHIVPRDMPAASLELLKRWLGGRPLYA